MVRSSRNNVAVIGSGPAGLMAADVLSDGGAHVTVYDRMPSVGRKFLMAGRGGLNLTHSEALPKFLERYGARDGQLGEAIKALPPSWVRSWCEGLGQETFVGSSGRVFPRAMKASPLLRAWLQRLGDRGVVFETRHSWQGWNEEGALLFVRPDGAVVRQVDATVLAVGGASWPRLGSDGGWTELLEETGVGMAPLRPANCGFGVDWSDIFRSRFEGQPLKRIAIRHGGRVVRGEAIVTAFGIEGGAVYALSQPLREAIAEAGKADRGKVRIEIDLRPDTEVAGLARMLDVPRRKQSMSTFLRKAARLSPVAIGLVQEAVLALPRQLGQLEPMALAELIKAVPVCLTEAAPLEKAISTAGGVLFEELDARFMLARRPGVFVAGEMLDWEAPTGGYLLQACFATGAAAGRGALEWLGREKQA